MSNGTRPVVPFGDTGSDISKIGFGSWAIGGPYKNGWGPVDDEVSIRTILAAVSNGLTWIDTAPAYGLGHSEVVVGQALKRLSSRERPLIFTKCGRVWGQPPNGDLTTDLRPSTVRQEVDDSLGRLGVEVLDLLQVHRPNDGFGTPIEETWGTMAELVNEGKVRWLGLSNVTLDLLQRCQAVRHVESLQTKLNLFDPVPANLLPWCQTHATAVLGYSALASGLLAGGFSLDKLAPDDWRRRATRFQEPKLSNYLAVGSRIETLAKSNGCSLAEFCLAWVLGHPGVTAVIVGARSPGQLQGWARAWQVQLPEAVRELASTLAGEADVDS